MTYTNGVSVVIPTAVLTAPDPELKKAGSRRKYTAKFKLKILDKADLLEGGEMSAFLRREGLYASMVRRWREERQSGLLENPKNDEPPLSVKEGGALRRKVQQLENKLHQAQTIMDAQKKLLSLFESLSDEGL